MTSPKEQLHKAMIDYGVAKVELDQAFKAVGKFIRQRRKEAGLSLRDLAKNTGLSAPYISDVELGRRNANPKLINYFKD